MQDDPGAIGALAPAPLQGALFDLTTDELDRYPAGVITLSRSGHILRYNRAESALSRLEPHRVIGRHFFRDVAPCTAVRDFQGRFEIFAAGTRSAVERFDWTFMFRWGRQDVAITLMRRERRPEIHVVVVVRSASSPVATRIVESLVAPERSGAAAPSRANDTAVGIWADDVVASGHYRSGELHQILGAGEELETQSDPIVRYVHPDHVIALESEMRHARDQRRSYLVRTLIVTGDGREKDVLVHGAFLEAGDPLAPRSIGSVVDLTERTNVDRRLWESAYLDSLTQLPNRRALFERVSAELASATPALTLCFVDLDKFKRVNDSGGHAAGDRLLQIVAERITRAVRPSDLVARINGDEFVVAFFDTPSQGALDALVGRLIDAVAKPFTIEGKRYTIGASVGIARYPTDGSTVDDLLAAADAAMYAAKSSGSGNVRYCDEALRENAMRERDRASELANAIDRGKIVPHFQAIVDATTGAVVGAEALARWEHPLLGTLPPSAFIALAERGGLIGELGRSILHAACAAAKSWYDALGEAAPSIAVNVSPLQFRDRAFATTVREELERSGLPPHKLELELTESLIMDRFDETMVALADLKILGVRLAIDDFGTGYSALAYLKYFPVDTVKLDRAFVDGVGVDSLDESIVETVVTLARKLHLDVIAEGVERREQAEKLVALGCRLLQGFLYSSPSPAAVFDAWLATRPRAAGVNASSVENAPP